MRTTALLALTALATVVAAQSSIERWNTQPLPGNVAANSHVPFGATLLPNGNYSLSSTSRGNNSSLTYFSSVNRSNGALNFFRAGQPYIEIRGTAVGPGGRVAQFGSRSGSGADAMSTVFNGAGTTLTSVYDGPLGPTFQEVITAAAFDAAGNLYVAGSAVRQTPLFSTSWVAKYNSAGVRQWAVTPNLVSSTNGDRPVGMGVDPTGNVWVAVNRNDQFTHVWRLNPAGVTLFGSQWQIGGQRTIPVTARMANNRFVVLGNTGNPTRLYVRQYLNNVNWVTYDSVNLTTASNSASAFTFDQFGRLYVAMNFPNSTCGIFSIGPNNLSGGIQMLPNVQTISAMFRPLMGEGKPVFFVGRGFINGSFRAMAGHTIGPVIHTGTAQNQIPEAAAFNEQNGELFVASSISTSPLRIGTTLIDFAPISTNPSFVTEPFTSFFGALKPLEYNAENATFSLVSTTPRGTLNLDSDGGFSYIPDQISAEPYDDLFTYTINKPGLAPVSGNCLISVRP